MNSSSQISIDTMLQRLKLEKRIDAYIAEATAAKKTPLLYAVYKDDFEMLDALILFKRKDVNEIQFLPDGDKVTPLFSGGH